MSEPVTKSPFEAPPTPTEESAPTKPTTTTTEEPPTSTEPTADQLEQQQLAAEQAATTIEAGSDTYSDAGYESDFSSRASTSISSSVRDYAFENGRRYHAFRAGNYQFPNDESEQEREDMKHAMIINLCGGKLHFAPLENPQQVLDIGTGTGIWAIDMGDEYPSAQVLGIDLSPIQPHWLPPNVKFMVDDAESPWLHKPKTFDFIHSRHMCSAIKDWPKLLSSAYTAIKPGGWIELQDLQYETQCDDGTLKEDYDVQKWLRLIKEGLAAFGINLSSMVNNAQYLQDAGFVNIQSKVMKVPCGVWPKNQTMKMVGMYMRSVIYDGLQGISMGPFTRGLKWTPDEVELLLVDVRKSLFDISTHSYLPFHIYYGQKPLDG